MTAERALMLQALIGAIADGHRDVAFGMEISKREPKNRACLDMNT